MSELSEDRLVLDRAERREVRARSLGLLREILRPLAWPLVRSLVYVTVAIALATALPWLIAYALNRTLEPLLAGDARPALLVVGAYVLAAVASGVLMYLNMALTARLSQQALYSLRVRMFRHSQELSVGFHERYTAGRVTSRLTSDLETLRTFLDSGLSPLAAALFSMVFAVVALFSLSPLAGLLMLVVLIPVGFLARWFQYRSAIAFRAQRTVSASLIGRFAETFTGIRAVKAFGVEAAARQAYGEQAEDYRLRVMDSIKVFGVFMPSLAAANHVFVASVFVVGGYAVLGGDMQVGTLLALVIYASRVFEPVMELSQFYNQFQSAISALEKVSAFLAQKPDISNPATPAQRQEPAKGELVFRDVSFSYSEEGGAVLHPLNLTVPAGQQLALVGQTGAGKSTIAKLLARFYDVSTGSITLDGIDLRDLTDAQLRTEVVMVTQEAFLFSGSVADNIRLGNPQASDQQVEDAARAVGAHDFISALPQGYETNLGKRGGRVSAGQRQLISFARAFLADPAVLILDEATASLDIPSEELVQRGLTQLLAGRTSLVIAHRLSTVLTSDRVLVVDRGRVIEDGSPSQLIAAGGPFAALHANWERSMTL